MKILSPYFGELEYSEEDIFKADAGLLGFPEDRRFLLIRSEDSYPFYWLQSLDNPHISFAVVDPELVVPDYALNLEEEDIKELRTKRRDQVKALAITVLSRKLSEITANLQAPVIFDFENKTMKQIILSDGRYSIRHGFIKKRLEKEACGGEGGRC